MLFFCSDFVQACGDTCKTLEDIRVMMKAILKEDEKKKGDTLINGLRRALEKERRLD